MSHNVYPKNPVIRNGKWADLYLFLLRKKIKPLAKFIGLILGCEISFKCILPKVLFLAHPNGIIVGRDVVLGENVVLNHQVTLGGKTPYLDIKDLQKDFYPILKEGVYVGAGAKILGNVTINEWAIIGANAVITKDVPAYATVVGYNKIIKQKINEKN